MHWAFRFIALAQCLMETKFFGMQHTMICFSPQNHGLVLESYNVKVFISANLPNGL